MRTSLTYDNFYYGGAASRARRSIFAKNLKLMLILAPSATNAKIVCARRS